MATIVLQAAGAFLGGMLGPIGSAIGTAAGALAGYAVDRALIDSTRRIEGPRLTGARPFTAEEGASLPRIYGTARVGGTLIWATRFKETRSTRRQGKLGPKVTEYSYYGNAAFALCEGEIAGIRRVWADGREVDRETIELRVHTRRGEPGRRPADRGQAGCGQHAGLSRGRLCRDREPRYRRLRQPHSADAVRGGQADRRVAQDGARRLARTRSDGVWPVDQPRQAPEKARRHGGGQPPRPPCRHRHRGLARRAADVVSRTSRMWRSSSPGSATI